MRKLVRNFCRGICFFLTGVEQEQDENKPLNFKEAIVGLCLIIVLVRVLVYTALK
jgi:hypothetical protein